MVFEALLEMSKTLMGRRESACSLPERRRPIGRDGVGLTEGLACLAGEQGGGKKVTKIPTWAHFTSFTLFLGRVRST